MGKYKPYPEYKDSGVEWLGDVPEHWVVTKLKRYCNVTDGSHHSPEIELEGQPFVSVTDVGENNIDFENVKKISNQNYTRLVREGCKPSIGDILLTKDGTIGRACLVKESMPEFVILSSLGLLTPTKQVFDLFLYYYLVSGINIDQMNSTIHGSALRRMTIGKIDDLIFTFPHKFEQTQIAAFLDHETAQIDRLIEKQEKLIKLLKEKRQAVISYAVTKGLNPDAPMKDSGVEWLGEVPEHWKIISSKFLYNEQNRPVRSKDQIITAYRDGEVTLRLNRRATGYTLADKEVGYQGVRGGDLVIQSMDAFAGAIGVSDSEGKCSPEYVVCLPYEKNTSCEYHALLLRIMAQRDYIFMICPSVRERAPRFRYSKFAAVKLAVPPHKEQLQILSWLSAMLIKNDALNDRAISQIELLKERRTALISAAVTGKIDVRDWQKN